MYGVQRNLSPLQRVQTPQVMCAWLQHVFDSSNSNGLQFMLCGSGGNGEAHATSQKCPADSSKRNMGMWLARVPRGGGGNLCQNSHDAVSKPSGGCSRLGACKQGYYTSPGGGGDISIAWKHVYVARRVTHIEWKQQLHQGGKLGCFNSRLRALDGKLCGAKGRGFVK